MDVNSAHAVFRAVTDGTLAPPEFIASEVTFTPRIEITAHSPLYAQLRSPRATRWARLLADHLDRWFADFYPGSMQHDCLTLSAALDLPFVDSDRLSVEMDTAGRFTKVPPGRGTLVRWSLSATYEPFMDWLTDVVTSQFAASDVRAAL